MFSLFRKSAPAPVPVVTAAEWRTTGNAALAAGDFAQAQTCYAEATRIAPEDAASWLNLGFAQMQLQAWPQARSSLERAGGLEAPEVAHDVQFLLAQVAVQQGEPLAALAHLQAALAAKPDFAEACADAARLAVAHKRWPEALPLTRRLRQLQPGPAAALLEARALLGAGEPAQALEVLDALLASDAGNAEALEGRGNVLLELKRPAEALAAFEQALAQRGPDTDTLSNGASALAALDRFDEALAWTERALALDPRHRNALFNRSQVLLEADRPREALEVAQQALQWHPGDADFEWNIAYALLILGDLRQGWPAYEARWRAPVLSPCEPVPGVGRPWRGEDDVASRSLLLFSEQGLGDTIQFLRLLPQACRRAHQVFLRVQPPLVPLLPDLPANCQLVPPQGPLPKADYECAMLSLPMALGTDWDNLPRTVPYVRAQPERSSAWETRLREPVRRPRIGLAWSGNPRHKMDRKRSLPLAALRTLDDGRFQFVSLQKEVREEDAQALRSWPGLLAFGDELHDFGDTAALAARMDLVIAVDTSIAHLAGALGRPVWILLAHAGEWRWLREREDTPWYPTARLYRQPAAGDWDAVLARIQRDLASFEAAWRASGGVVQA